MLTSSLAEKTEVGIIPEKNNPPETGTTRPRAPMHLPIRVFYDDVTREVEIVSGIVSEGNVYIYDANANIIAYTASLNETLYIPNCYTESVYVHIETEEWHAIGEIPL